MNISIPKIAPLIHGYTFKFKQGVNLITGLNGTGKTRIAAELIKAILDDKNFPVDPSLILVDEDFSRFAYSKFYKVIENSLNPELQNIICEKANHILFSNNSLTAKPIGKIVFTHQQFRFENLSSSAAGEIFLLYLSLLLAFRDLDKQLEDMPLIIDGAFGILDLAHRNFAFELLRKHCKYTILLGHPYTIDFLDSEALKTQFSTTYKIVVKIPKDKDLEGMFGHTEITGDPSEEYLCKIETV